MSAAVLEFDPLRDLRHRRTKAARECADWLAFLEVEGKSPRTLDDYERTVADLLRLYPRHRSSLVERLEQLGGLDPSDLDEAAFSGGMMVDSLGHRQEPFMRECKRVREYQRAVRRLVAA